jgi:hypothetical protein
LRIANSHLLAIPERTPYMEHYTSVLGYVRIVTYQWLRGG